MQKNLRKKPTFDELINYIEVEQPKIRYPDRTATFLRNTHYLSQFDGLFDLEEQEKVIAKEEIKEKEIVRTATATQGTASVIRSNATLQQNRSTTAQGNAAQEQNTKPIRGVIQTIRKIKGVRREPRSITDYGDAETFNMAAYDGVPSAIADTTLDRITDEAMEQADAAMDQARTEEERKRQRVVAAVSNNLGGEVKDTEIEYLPHAAASSSNVNPKPVRSRSPPKAKGKGKGKGKGRPPKVKDEPVVKDEPIVKAESKGRGRPPKVKEEPTQPKRERSRDPTAASSSVAVASSSAAPASSSSPSSPPKAKAKAKAKARAPSQAPQPRAKAKAQARASSADDAVISGVSVNKSEDMEFWKQQSANELRVQLKLRYPQRFRNEWAFKMKADLFKIIEELIKNKQW